jgi:quinol monooxygenase YgiN
MSTKPLNITAAFKARPGKEAELRDALIALLGPTRKEPGCLSYDLHQCAGDPARLLMYETWKDQAAIDAHMNTPHVQKLVPHVDRLCAEAPQIVVWERVG